MVGSRISTTSRRAGRITNKTKLLIYRGSDKIDENSAETILIGDTTTSSNNHASTAENSVNGNEVKHQHVGAQGVESGEMLEHHLQAALSSHSLRHSQPTRASSPSAAASKPTKPDASTISTAALNYHIPTPDATGLVQQADYTKLYETPVHRYVEPHNYIRYSDTVEEASGGPGGLGYCMDDEDEKWLADFNGKQQGGSGSGSGSGTANGSASTSKEGANGSGSPLREKHHPAVEGKENVPLSAGRERRMKGKEREKEKEKDSSTAPAPLVISETTFEFVMGIFEKYVEDQVPMLHTDLALLPPFSNIEQLFSQPLSSSFLPSHEIPRSTPDHKVLIRMARSIYSHWKDRRERRKGRSIMPQLNYDETNDGDPYVCFRRRDIRATRKTRRTDNFSVEKMQKLQYELRSAHQMALLVVSREKEKKKLFDAEKEVWEAKWKLFETKKRWPSLGLTREEEEIITGRISSGTNYPGTPASAGPGGIAGININLLNGQNALQNSGHPNVPRASKKMLEREKEERERREKAAALQDITKSQEKSGGSAARYYAPDELKARMQALTDRLDEVLSKRKEADQNWDDSTDSSFQPLPLPPSDTTFRSITSLDPQTARERHMAERNGSASHPTSFRLRRGRGGLLHFDRRPHSSLESRDSPSSSSENFSSWLFPDSLASYPSRRRPKSIDEVEENSDEDAPSSSKRQRLNEIWRYNSDRGGGLGVGMGLPSSEDSNAHVLIDDMDEKYIRYRITLLDEEDLEKLKPDLSIIKGAMASIDEPEEMPPTPVFVRPAPPNPQFMAQQLIQQQQLEQFTRYQMQAQLQAQLAVQQQQAQAAAQVQAAAQAQAQAQAAAQAHAQQQQQQQSQQGGDGSAPTPQLQHPTPRNSSGGTPAQSNQSLPPASQKSLKRANSSANSNNSMPPPSQTPIPASQRPSQSPSNNMHPPLPNGQSPVMVNGQLPNGKPMVNQIQLSNGQTLDPAVQQKLMATARAQMVAQAQAAQLQAAAQAQHQNQYMQQQQFQQQQQQQQQQFPQGFPMMQNGNMNGLDMNDPNIASLNAILAASGGMLNAAANGQLQMNGVPIPNMANIPNLQNFQQNMGMQNNGMNGNIEMQNQVDVNGMIPQPHMNGNMNTPQQNGQNGMSVQDAKTRTKLLKLAAQQQAQQNGMINQSLSPQQTHQSPIQQVQMQLQGSNQGSSPLIRASPVGTPGGNVPQNNPAQGVMGSPNIPNAGHLHLKLPAHAAARLAGQQAARAQ